MAWLYLPDTVASSLESKPPSETFKLWVTLSGKATQRPLSWRGWERRPWIRLLSGTTLPPSTAARGAELWISSLRDSRVSRSVQRVPDEASAMSAGSGTISRESFAKFNPDGSLVKTSLDLFLLDSTPYSGPLPASGMMLAGELFELSKWEPAIDASGSSSSQSWETPNTNPEYYFRKQSGAKLRNDPMLPALAIYWPKDREEIREIEAENLAIGKTTMSANWPTPQAHDSQGGKTPEQVAKMRSQGHGVSNLNEAAPNWPTPTVNSGDQHKDMPTPNQTGGTTLGGASKNWPTPMAADDGHKTTANSHQPGLIGATKNWATPLAGEAKSGQTSTNGKVLSREAEIDFSRSGLRISTCGPECSPNHRRLNPQFVEWLMGLPSCWTVAKIGSGPAETALSHYRQQLQSECSRIARVGP